MKTARFIYKCRRCGGLKTGPSTAAENGMLGLADVVLGAQRFLAGIPITLTDAHACEDGGGGISDLQGYDVVDE